MTVGTYNTVVGDPSLTVYSADMHFVAENDDFNGSNVDATVYCDKGSTSIRYYVLLKSAKEFSCTTTQIQFSVM